MQGIAFEFYRPAVDGRRDERNRTRPAWHRRRVVEKLSRNRPFRALRERHEMHFRPATTRETDPGQRHRRAHQFHEIAARPFVVVELRRAGGEFALEPFAEFRGVAVLTGAATVAFLLVRRFGRMLENALHRWQVWQFVLALMCQRSLSV